ncbi:MAG: Ig-like domain-containing protein [Ramlibacter sp.]|nr:Ig-like domain-containing protein [Ramlibacter sp.]
MVTGITPAANATGVNTTTTVEVSFSEALQLSSITDAAVTLRTSAGPVTATVGAPVAAGARGATVRLSPAQPLALLTRHELRLADTIQASTGARFAGLTATFTTADGSWQPPQQIAANSDYLSSPVLAGNQAGRKLAVWVEAAPGGQGEWALRGSPLDAGGNAWLASAPIYQGALFPTDLRISIDSGGHGLAVWTLGTATDIDPRANQYLWTSFFDASQGVWRTPVQVMALGQRVGSSFKHAFDPGGNAVVAWLQGDPNTALAAIWVARYQASTRMWSAAEKVTDLTRISSDHLLADFEVTADSGGNVHVIWMQGAPSSNVQARSFEAATGQWGQAQVLHPLGSASPYSPRMAVDGNGRVVALWTEILDDQRVLLTRSYDRRTAQWGSPSSLSIGPLSGVAQMGLEPDGNVLVIWSQNKSGQIKEHWASRYDSGAGAWRPPEKIWTSVWDSYVRALAVDKAGNVVVLGDETTQDAVNKTVKVFALRYRADTRAWQSPYAIDIASVTPVPQYVPESVRTLAPPQLAMDSDGTAWGLWETGLSSVYGYTQGVQLNQFR